MTASFRGCEVGVLLPAGLASHGTQPVGFAARFHLSHYNASQAAAAENAVDQPNSQQAPEQKKRDAEPESFLPHRSNNQG